MSRIAFLIGFVLVSTQFTALYAATLQAGAASIIRGIQELELTNDYTKQFSALLQLKLEQGSKVDEVLSMIKELLDQLKTDQQMDDVEHSETMARFTQQIEELEQNLESLNTELVTTNNFIVVVTRELEALDETIKNLQAQLVILNSKEDEIRTARQADEIAYNRRKQNSERIVQALTLVIEKLTAAVFKQEGGAVLLEESEREEILSQIRNELGHNHPIAILVAMTTKFDAPTVKNIIEKLETIRTAVIASQVDDDAHEVQAIEIFETLIREITEVRDRLSEDLSTNLEVFNRKTNEKVLMNVSLTLKKILAEQTKEQLEIEIPLTEKILSETKTQKDLYHAAYESRTIQRGQEIQIVQAAYNLVNDQVQLTRKTEGMAAALNGI